jgi:hypothetical protein
MIVPLLFLRATNEDYSSSSDLSAPTEFGFTTSGRYVFTIISATRSPIVFGLVTKKQYDGLPVHDVNMTALLSGDDRLCDVQETYIDSPATLSGNISEQNIYRIFLFSGVSSSYSAVISLDFSNGHTRLDYREFPGLIEQPIALGLFGAVLIFWLVNWLLNCSLRIYIHRLLTGMFVSAVVARCLRYVLLKDRDVHDLRLGTYAVSVMSAVIFEQFLYVVILLCAKGWCIVRSRIKRTELIRSVILTVVLVVVRAVEENTSPGRTMGYIIILTIIVALFLYVRELIKSIHLASMYLEAYLLEIRNADIDPMSTPVWRKQRMFDQLQYCILAYCVCMLVTLIVGVFVDEWPWVPALMQDIVDLSIVIGMAIVFRLRGGARNGYQEIGESDLMLEDIEVVPAVGALRKGGKQWETGMVLPPPPGTRPSTITIVSPEGMFEVQMRQESA